MMSSHTQLWLALSRAFLPPVDHNVAEAFIGFLPDDLEELLDACGIDALPAIGALAESLGELGSAEALLVHYSSLFLPPSAKATLNLAVHFDGSLNGAAMDAIEDAMARHGIGKAEEFHDMPDHLASMLEILALISSQAGAPDDAAAFARAFLLPALPRLEAQIAEHDGGSPYLHLVRIALAALAPYALPEERNRRRERAKKRADTELGVWRVCKACGKPYAREKEILIMSKALQEQGLPTAHLELCTDCRAPSGDWLRKQSLAT
jgi:TorA maturation chaperone TorD